MLRADTEDQAEDLRSNSVQSKVQSSSAKPSSAHSTAENVRSRFDPH